MFNNCPRILSNHAYHKVVTPIDCIDQLIDASLDKKQFLDAVRASQERFVQSLITQAKKGDPSPKFQKPHTKKIKSILQKVHGPINFNNKSVNFGINNSDK